MSTTCKIEFEDNPEKVFYAGQLLRGTAELNFKSNKSVRCVYIRIQGFGFVHWKEHRRPAQNKEDYLNEVTCFVGGFNNANEIEMKAGAYKFNFEFMLPHSLPSSIEGDCGHVRYVATVIFDTPLWIDRKFEESFSVIRSLDLSKFRALRNSVAVEVQEKIAPFLFSCSKTEPVKITARMAVGGYNTGETIKLEVTVNNVSKQPFYEFTAKLSRHATFVGRTNSVLYRTETITVAGDKADGCEPNEKKTIQMSIEVPQTPSTDTSASKVVKIRYFVHITAVTPAFYTSPRLHIPVVIASIPTDIKPKQIQVAPTTDAILQAEIETIELDDAVPPNDVILQPPNSARNTAEPTH